MTDSQLEKLLKSAPAPERTPDYWEEFPACVRARLQTKPVCSPAFRLFRLFAILPQRLAWPTAIATICLIVGFSLGQWHKPSQKMDYALLQNESTVRQILTMFPNRVRAILQTEQGLQLVLSDKPDVPTSTPLWIQVGEGKQGQAAVTFSGQEIQIGGEKMTVLSDAQGGVILMAKQLIWSSTAPNQGPNNIKIQAKTL